MRIQGFDHLVLTTNNLPACICFYRDILGMRVETHEGRYALYFGQQKINIHQRPGEFPPAAQKPTPGSQDFCLEVDEPIADVYAKLQERKAPIELGPVKRYGARGDMDSIYLRDPDGNLIELCCYAQ